MRPRSFELLHIFLLGLSLISVGLAAVSTPSRKVLDLDDDWRFNKGDSAAAMTPAFDDAAWREVNLPHDWSSEGPFGPEYGSGNGYAPGGIGWYRKHFTVSEADTNKVIAVEFDGIYDHSQVWFNGHYVGGRPYTRALNAC